MIRSDTKHPGSPAPSQHATPPTACVYCGYDVRSIPLATPCPECGRLIALSVGMERFRSGVHTEPPSVPLTLAILRRALAGLSCILGILLSFAATGIPRLMMLSASLLGLTLVVYRAVRAIKRGRKA